MNRLISKANFFMIAALIILAATSINGQKIKSKPKVKSVTGTIIAFDNWLSLMPCYHICGGSFIFRLNNSTVKNANDILISFSYPDKNFPQELFVKKRRLTIQVERTKEKDFRLKEFVPMEDITTGKISAGQMLYWQKVPGAETDQIKYGEIISTYNLTQKISELIKIDQ